MDLDFLESMMGEVEEESPYRGIWVVAEQQLLWLAVIGGFLPE